MAGNSDMPRTAKSRAGARSRSGRKQAGNGSAHSDVMADEIALDALSGHAGYAVRRFRSGFFRILCARSPPSISARRSIR